VNDPLQRKRLDQFFDLKRGGWERSAAEALRDKGLSVRSNRYDQGLLGDVTVGERKRRLIVGYVSGPCVPVEVAQSGSIVVEIKTVKNRAISALREAADQRAPAVLFDLRPGHENMSDVYRALKRRAGAGFPIPCRIEMLYFGLGGDVQHKVLNERALQRIFGRTKSVEFYRPVVLDVAATIDQQTQLPRSAVLSL